MKPLQFFLVGLFTLGLARALSAGPLPAPEPLMINTPDQAEVRLYHYPGKKPSGSPVVLVPEVGTSHLIFDLPAAGGLATYLARRGKDVWVLEFRGAGAGSAPLRDFSLDELLSSDLPAGLNRIRKETGAEDLSLIGLGLGGTLLLEYVSSRPAAGNGGDNPAIRNLVLLNSPGSSQAASELVKIWAQKSRALSPGEGIDLKKSCLLPSPFPAVPGQLFHLLFWGPVKDEETEAAVCTHGLVTIPAALARQLAAWVETGKLLSRDGHRAYLQNLKQITRPALFLSGQLDSLFPTWQVDSAFQALGSERKKLRVFGRANRYRKEYGHLDLVAGRDAEREVFPCLLDWLEKN